MDYGALIRDAFRITLRNRFLWFFGFFAAGSGAAFTFSSPPPGFGGNFPADEMENVDSALSLAAQNVRQWISDNLALILSVAAVALAIFLFFFALGAISRGALVESVAAIDRGERRGFSPAWRAGLSNFWRVVELTIAFFLIWAGMLVVIGGPLMLLFVGTSDDSLALRLLAAFNAFWLAAILTVIVFIPVGIIGQFALRELVIGRGRVPASIAGGYRIFRRNLGRSFLVWLIQVVIAVGVGIALFIATLIAGLISAILPIILLILELKIAAVVTAVVFGLIILAFILVTSAAISAFNHSYWTLAYLRLSVGEAADSAPV